MPSVTPRFSSDAAGIAPCHNDCNLSQNAHTTNQTRNRKRKNPSDSHNPPNCQPEMPIADDAVLTKTIPKSILLEHVFHCLSPTELTFLASANISLFSAVQEYRQHVRRFNQSLRRRLPRHVQWMQEFVATMQAKGLFESKVLGPIAMEIAPKSNSMAAFLEMTYCSATLNSFVVQTESDLNTFRRVSQTVFGRELPVIQISSTHKDMPFSQNAFYSTRKLKRLQKEFGVVGYLRDSFVASTEVRQALEQRCRLDNSIVCGCHALEFVKEIELLHYLAEPEEVSASAPQPYHVFIPTLSVDMAGRCHVGHVSKYAPSLCSRTDFVDHAKLLL